jgi:hypothetical protein
MAVRSTILEHTGRLESPVEGGMSALPRGRSGPIWGWIRMTHYGPHDFSDGHRLVYSQRTHVINELYLHAGG